MSIGLGVVLPPEATFAMCVGALLFWMMGRRHNPPGHQRATRSGSKASSPSAPGLISGAALMGIGNAIVNVLM